MNFLDKIENYFHMKRHGYPTYLAMWESYNYAIKAPGLYSRDFNRAKLSKYKIVFLYAVCNESLEEIAKKHNCTRERVRQILCKVYYNYKYQRLNKIQAVDNS